jgi:hypothetical protein
MAALILPADACRSLRTSEAKERGAQDVTHRTGDLQGARGSYFFQFAITMNENMPPLLAMLSAPSWNP